MGVVDGIVKGDIAALKHQLQHAIDAEDWNYVSEISREIYKSEMILNEFADFEERVKDEAAVLS